MSETTATRAVVVERDVPHPPEKVWRALTESALIAEWLMTNDFQPVVGHRFTFRMAPVANWNGVTDCEVLIVEPYTRLAYTWAASGESAATGLQTVVTWTLTPTPGGALVRMEQTGFRAQDENNYRGATYGWQQFMGRLETVLAGL